MMERYKALHAAHADCRKHLPVMLYCRPGKLSLHRLYAAPLERNAMGSVSKLLRKRKIILIPIPVVACTPGTKMGRARLLPCPPIVIPIPAFYLMRTGSRPE